MTPTLEAIRSCCDEVGDCWLWRKGMNAAGYPLARFGGRSWVIRRFVYLELLGKKLLSAHHRVATRCGDTRCVSPECLMQRTVSAITQKSYTKRDRQREHFTRRAAAHRLAKLTLAQAREIRARCAAGETRTAVARDYGMSQSMVSRIALGDSWKEPAAPTVFDLAWLEAA
jgi:hypothetical protein